MRVRVCVRVCFSLNPVFGCGHYAHACAKVPNVQKTMGGIVEWGKAELEEMKKKAKKEN